MKKLNEEYNMKLNKNGDEWQDFVEANTKNEYSECTVRMAAGIAKKVETSRMPFILAFKKAEKEVFDYHGPSGAMVSYTYKILLRYWKYSWKMKIFSRLGIIDTGIYHLVH